MTFQDFCTKMFCAGVQMRGYIRDPEGDKVSFWITGRSPFPDDLIEMIRPFKDQLLAIAYANLKEVKPISDLPVDEKKKIASEDHSHHRNILV